MCDIRSAFLQELIWKRSPSANVKMYELTIKKEEERAVSFEVEDVEDPLNDVYCRGEVGFTLPDQFSFEEGSKYKINVYRLINHIFLESSFIVLLQHCRTRWRAFQKRVPSQKAAGRSPDAGRSRCRQTTTVFSEDFPE